VDRRVVGVFTSLLDELCHVPGFQLHSGSGLGDGDWGYEDRTIGGSNSLSFHAFGLALDINAPFNPQGLSRPTPGPFTIPQEADAIALRHGILWGGNARFTRPDRMHFEVHLAPDEIGPQHPRTPGPVTYPLTAGRYFGRQGVPNTESGYGTTSPYLLADIKAIQHAVGVTPDGLYGPATAAAVAKWQGLHHLTADALVGPLTWRSLFPW
jgi:peptidoglycan hydrolase-like protein with peptidoglycan-binding domain